MSIERADFDAIIEADLSELVTAQVPEGLRLEYKLETYGKTDAERREFLKDVSALANSVGGHLIIGAREVDGIATEFVGLEATDAEILRLGQIARNGLEPRISGLRMKAIVLAAGGAALLLRVPSSWNRPHRVVAQGANRFYVRHSAGVHEPNVEELRTLFSLSGSFLERARQFRAERIADIQAAVGERPLVGGGRLILHIVPIASFAGAVTLDMEQVYAEHGRFVPLGQPMGLTPRYNYHGFINERGGDYNHGYTQIFRDGRLEATKASILRDHDGGSIIPGLAQESAFFGALAPYLDGLRAIGVPPPLVILLTMEGVIGARYVVRRNLWDDFEPVLPENVLSLPECVLEDYGTEAEYHRTVRPIFDALWNAAGYARAQSFNEEGIWIGRAD